MNEVKQEEMQVFQVVDKDYGRTKMVGSGYGDISAEQYEALEALVNQ